VVAATSVSENGQFEIAGIREGSYRLRVAGEFGSDMAASDEADIKISVADIVRKDFRLLPENTSISTLLIGSSPQISKLSATLVRGSSTRIFLGGNGLNSGIAKIEILGTGIVLGPNDLRFLDYGNSVKVISFELPESADLADGEYSLLVEDLKGVRRFIVGALSIIGQ